MLKCESTVLDITQPVNIALKERVREVPHLMAQDSSGEQREAASNLGLILIVEDDVRTLRLERFVLEEEGYAVVEVNSGEDALEALKLENPSLILLDIGLPGIDGFTTCQRIRESSRVPIIMVTAEDRDEDKVRGLEMGADDYVTKPFAVAELAARVKAVLRRFDMDAPPGSSDPSAAPNVNQASPGTSPYAGESDSNEPLPKPSGAGDDADIYEGTVKLEVRTTGTVRGMIQFVDELRQSEDFHLLRLVADQNKEGMDIWLRLRGPVELKSTLLTLDAVCDVEIPTDSGSGGSEPLLRVSLGR